MSGQRVCLVASSRWFSEHIWLSGKRTGWLPPALCPTQTLVWPHVGDSGWSPSGWYMEQSAQRLERVLPGPRWEQATSQYGPYPPCSVSKDAWVCWPEGRPAWQLPDSSPRLSDKPWNFLVAGKNESRGQDWYCQGGLKNMTASECQVAWQNRSCALLSGWRSDFGAGQTQNKFYLDSSCDLCWVIQILWASISVLTISYISWWTDICVQFLNIVNNLCSSLFLRCKATNPGFTPDHLTYWAPHSRPLSTCPNYTGAC